MVHGINNRKSNLEKSIGMWVSLSIGNSSVYGVIKEAKGMDVTFNPHRALRYNAEKGCNLYRFVEEDSFLEISPYGYYLEPTSKETLDYYTKKQNEEILKNKEKEDLELIKKVVKKQLYKRFITKVKSIFPKK